ncbi:MAG: hypothetical protein RIT28_1760 [Pseudomonadota bacterium]
MPLFGLTPILLTLGLATAGEPVEDALAALVAGDYAEATRLHVAAVNAGEVSGDVYYNLGVSLYREDAIPEAILAWRRAAVLAPRDGDILLNLDHARRRTQDRVEAPALDSWMFWRSSFSFSEQGWAAALCLSALGALGALWRLRPDAPVGIPALLIGVPAVAFCVSTAAELQALGDRPDAVVLVTEIPVRSEGAGGVVLFTLHAGAEVNVRERVGAQALIALPDDRVGWVPFDTLGLVDPRLPFPSPPAKPAG